MFHKSSAPFFIANHYNLITWISRLCTPAICLLQFACIVDVCQLYIIIILACLLPELTQTLILSCHDHDHVFPMQLEFGPVKLKAKKHKLPKVKVKGFSSSSNSSSSSSDSSSDSDWAPRSMIIILLYQQRNETVLIWTDSGTNLHSFDCCYFCVH